VNEAVVCKKSVLLMEIFGPKWNEFSSDSRWILEDAALVQYRYFQSEPALYIFPRINMYDSPAPDQTTSTITRYPTGMVWHIRSKTAQCRSLPFRTFTSFLLFARRINCLHYGIDLRASDSNLNRLQQKILTTADTIGE